MYVDTQRFIVSSSSWYVLLLVYQQIPQNSFQSNMEVLGNRMRRSVDYSDDINNGSIHNDLNDDSRSPSLIIESSMS